VEGANILTRSLIIFGQGAIRCHPWLFKEMEAVKDPDPRKQLESFDTAIQGHVAFFVHNLGRALFLNVTGARFVEAPVAGPTGRWYAEVERMSASFALVADLALLILGGALKRRERISGRFADILSELYFMSAVLKRFEDEGRPAEDLPLVDWVCFTSLYGIEQSLDAILSNFPSRAIGWFLRRMVFPWGRRRRAPDDTLGHKVAALLLEPSETRDRLTAGIYVSRDPADITGRLEHALEVVPQTEAIQDRLSAAVKEGKIPAATGAESLKAGILTAEEAELLKTAEKAIRAAIDVDDFAPEELGGRPPEKQTRFKNNS
jgi:acyl-CoA dehydrogenase